MPRGTKKIGDGDVIHRNSTAGYRIPLKLASESITTSNAFSNQFNINNNVKY